MQPDDNLPTLPDNSYGIDRWGMGFYRTNAAGHVTAHPNRQSDRALDLFSIVQMLDQRGVGCPLILRFDEMLRQRVDDLAHAFVQACQRANFRGRYQCVYPIKVNQQRQVVETIYQGGLPHGFGLEAGSKAELIAVLGTVSDDRTPIVCNGFKDDDYLSIALGAGAAGLDVTLVIEWLNGLDDVLRIAKQMNVTPKLGLRVRLNAKVTSRWEDSAGRHAKFGLTMLELEQAIQRLRETGHLSHLNMLHFHAGSQISDLAGLAEAIEELAELYCRLKQQGAMLDTLDLGGGLGIDYAGMVNNTTDSINYDLQTYADTMVSRVAKVCASQSVEPPNLITESGRALTAPHSVTIFNVLGHANEHDGLATYFINASVFQSLPDSWAIGQRFPIMPIHRLNEPPTLQGILVDITCDSDGKVDRFVTRHGPVETLPLHDVTHGQPYYLGAFLVGAYQEILGDLHNLFGDETIAHISCGDNGQPVIDRVIQGDPIAEILTYVDYDPDKLNRHFRRRIEQANADRRITSDQANAILQRYQQCLNGPTYLR